MSESMEERQLQFRKMKIQDISAVVQIENQLFSQPWSKQAFLESMEEDTLFVVAADQHEIVGYCGMYCSFEEGEITNVAVKPGNQNRGIDGRMLQYLLAQARQRNISRIILEVRVSNKNAIHLYKKLGFQNCGIRKNLYEMPKEDGMIMLLEG